MFFLFGFFFFCISVTSLFLGIFMLNYNSIVFDFLFPFMLLNDINFSLMFDFVSLIFFSFVSFISSSVFFYSSYYMHMSVKFESSDFLRFLILLFLFVFSMFILVFSSSWFMIMLGWDGLGVISFLLVIYYNNPKSLESGLVTVFTNRLGDCFFLLSFMFMFYFGFYSFEYLSVTSDMMVFGFILVLGCFTKSAQLPFSSWLPAAMAAPTPVSSLVHSSTLVTAGVYLLIRFNYLLEKFFLLMSVLSLMTMILASLFALFEVDFKKVVAMSTLSQLGFMIFSISLGNWLLSFLHMMFHAFFKSCLFLSTGSLMHLLLGSQDTREFGGFYMSFYSKLFFSMSCMSLMGFPFSLGFYSKDYILSSCFFLNNSFLIVSFFAFSCCLTVSYSIRLMKMGFFKFPSFNCFNNLEESSTYFFPVLMIFLVSIFIGNFFLYYFLPMNLIFSMFDLLLGVVVIVLGIIMFILVSSSKSYHFDWFLCSMMGLPLVISNVGLNSYNLYFFKDDISWNNYVIINSLLSVIKILKTTFFNFLTLKFFYFGILLVLFIILL